MQDNNRTATKQSNHSRPVQGNRAVNGQARSAGNQGNRTTGSHLKGSMNQQTSARQPAQAQKAPTKKQPIDRLGQAVVSLIFGIFGILLFFLAFIKMEFDSTYLYTISPGTMMTIIIDYILSVTGFILGIRARRSIKGRGMAIAGITLTALPVVLMTLLFLATLAVSFINMNT
ncbi:DUF4190 domain-containing protein [Paenibacillus marinisediminis]